MFDIKSGYAINVANFFLYSRRLVIMKYENDE